MKKIKINGFLLRGAISKKSLTIVNAAEKGGIGEKTIHRLLNGEAIKEAIVLKLFRNLGLNHQEYLMFSNPFDSLDDGKSLTIKNMQGANSQTTLFPFEMPFSGSIPALFIWDFDVSNPNDELLDLFKKLNQNLEEYCNAEDINSLSFEGSFTRLTSTSSIFNIIKEISKHKVFTFSGVYDYYTSSKEQLYDGKEDWVKYYSSSKRFYLYFTENSLLSHVIAKVNKGEYPPSKMEEGFSNVVVNGDYDYYNEDIPF